MAPSTRFEISSIVVLSVFGTICSGQLAFHTDQHTNSFTLKAPGLQQTFTRYFGGQHGNLLDQAQTAGQQPQQDTQNYAYQQQQDQTYNQQLLQQQQQAQYLQQQQQLQKQAAAQPQPQQYFQQQQAHQQAQQQSQQPQQQISAQEFAAYLQQAQYRQQQQQQAAPQGHAEQQQTETHTAALKSRESPATNNLLGVQYSPSNQVSHVKFSSGGLSYNF